MKNIKGARKISSMNGVLKIQICSGKIKKIEKSKMVESKYEIRTDLPSASVGVQPPSLRAGRASSTLQVQSPVKQT